MFYAILSGSVRKAVILGAVGALILVAGNPIGAAPPPTQVPNSPASAVTPGLVVLTQPVKVKIAYGETVLPAGMKLPVVSSDAASVRVKYMGQVQTIPIAAARFDGSAAERAGADPPATPFHNTWHTITSFAPAGLRLSHARRRHQHARIAITFVVTL